MDSFNRKFPGSIKREKLFFHDIINQTHGLILFLNQRASKKEIINVDEVLMLEKEIRALQSLIKDHFEFSHKNLENNYQWVAFSVAEEVLVNLIQTYLPSNNVKTFIHLKGDISYQESLEKRQSAIIYFPVFYRIMNNLIKNIAEARSTEVHFSFDFGVDGLIIETRNHFNKEEMPSSLEAGLGLESIEFLALQSGGSFEITKTAKSWINRITLPKFHEDALKKAS